MHSDLKIIKTEYWNISHRNDSRYLGYLIISALENVSDISELSPDALSELGLMLAETEKLLINLYSPFKVIISKLGFSKGFNCHFHMIPISEQILQEIARHPNYCQEPDGIDTMLFICREYCERPLNKEEDQNIKQEVKKLRKQYINMMK
ncbi:MAG: hypothetical protein J0H68_05800 [Sphingobacteriia bacterium]|nr:hypothetical protein [Sphingobacteriia bacterium]